MSLSPRLAAEVVGVCEKTLANWAKLGIAPPSFKVAGRRLFPVDGIRQWLADRARVSAESNTDTHAPATPQAAIGHTEVPSLAGFGASEEAQSDPFRSLFAQHVESVGGHQQGGER